MKPGRIPSRLALSLTVAALALAAPAAMADTLADALVKAYAGHPALASARAAVRSADEGVVQERSVGLGNIVGTGSLGLSSVGGSDRLHQGTLLSDRRNTAPLSVGVSGSIPLYSGGQVRYGINSAEQGVLAQRAAYLDAEQTVLLDAVTAYEDVRLGLGSVDLARNNVRVINEQVRAANDRFEVGEVTRTDVAQARARLAAARSNLATAVGSLAASRQAYLAAVGDLPEDLAAPPPIPQLPETEDAALSLAVAEHPLMVQARYLARQAEYEVKRAVGAGLPQVSLQGALTHSNTDTVNGLGNESNSASVAVNVEVPLWTGGRQPSQVRAAQATVAARQAQIHSIARAIKQQTSVAWAQLDVARASIRSSQEQVRAAQIAFDGVREEATLGARTTLDVLDAEAELLSARVGVIQAKRDEYVAAYTLLGAVGKLTVVHLGLNVAAYDPEAYMVGVDAAPYEWEQDESAAPEGEFSLFDGRP